MSELREIETQPLRHSLRRCRILLLLIFSVVKIVCILNLCRFVLNLGRKLLENGPVTARVTGLIFCIQIPSRAVISPAGNTSDLSGTRAHHYGRECPSGKTESPVIGVHILNIVDFKNRLYVPFIFRKKLGEIIWRKIIFPGTDD